MKSILAGNYVSDTNNPIKTPWGLTSNNNKIEYKMIDLNSVDRSFINNQMIFDEDTKKRVSEALDKAFNENASEKSLPEDTYSVDELVAYKKWYNQAAKNKLQISQTCKDWFEEMFALLIPFGVDYYKTKYKDTSLYIIQPIPFSIDVLKEIAGFANQLDLDVNKLVYDNLLIRIKQKEMQEEKQKEMNTDTHDEKETVTNAFVEKQEEIWAGDHIHTYVISDIYWISKWCEDKIKITKSIADKYRDASREIFKITGKNPEATSSLPIVDVYVFFSLKELKEIRNYASMYYSSNVKTTEAKNTLYDINLRIKYLEKQSEEILNALRKGYYETQNVMLETNTYYKEDIFWYADWVLDKVHDKTINNIILGCSKALKEVDAASRFPDRIICYIELKDLKEIRHYAMIHYNGMDHDFPDRKRLDKEMVALCRLEEKIAFMEEYRDARIKFQMEKEEKQDNSIETETNCKPVTNPDCKPENSNAFIICECRGIATGMCDVELKLSNVIRECIKHNYTVEYKYNDNCITKGYIQSGEMIHNLKNDSVSFKMEFVDTMNNGEFDIYSKVLDLKAIRFDDKTNTLYLQENA